MWWITNNAHGAFAARGVHGQTIYIDPVAEMVIVRLASHPIAGNAANDPYSLPTYEAVAEYLIKSTDKHQQHHERKKHFPRLSYIVHDGLSFRQDEKQNDSVASQGKQTEISMDETSITEKYWKLIRLEGRDVTMAKNQEGETYFPLKTADSLVTGFAGCNQFNGKYTLEKGNRIRFSTLATTMKACLDVAVKEPEVLEVFNLADNYTVNGDTLQLNVGRVLRWPRSKPFIFSVNCG